MENSQPLEFNRSELPQIARQYLSYNLSVIPVRDDKRPAIAEWASFQSTKMPLNTVTSAFTNPGTAGIAIIAGPVSGNLEVIDVDCKYDQTGFLWTDFFSLIQQYLPDLSRQLVIATTRNNGYHIYYRCSQTDGNKKLANNADKTVLIETRGQGGYVIAAPSPGYRFIQGNPSVIPQISPEEREKILSLAKSFDDTPVPVQKEKSSGNNKEFTGVSPFDDYNRKADVVSLLESHGWKVVRQSGDRVYLLRPGKSGNYISANYHLSKRIFYPFTSSTAFEAQKGYNPVQVFTLLECNGDFSQASHRLFEQGYGERRQVTASKQTAPKGAPQVPSAPAVPAFPLKAFPTYLQDLITICSKTYYSPVDYWAGAALIATALAIGDKMQLVDKYENVPILWLVIVGDVSTGKSFPLQFCLKYFKNLDSESIRQYEIELEEFDRINKMTAKERKEEGILARPDKPVCFQYILNDYTPEALVAAHKVNNRGLMIERDELKGWIDDFNRYNKSGEQSNMLSSWSRVGITYNRKLSGIMSIPKPTIFVGGGMQPDLLPSLAAENRAENGFLSRLCIIFPDNAKKGHYNDQLLSPEIYNSWEVFLGRLTKLKEPQKLSLSEEALDAYTDWYNFNADETNNQPVGYLKGVYGKLDIITLRLAIILHGMNFACKLTSVNYITFEEMESAIQLTEYFRATALKVYYYIFEKNASLQLDDKELANFLVTKYNVKKSDIASILKTSRSQVDRIIKK